MEEDLTPISDEQLRWLLYNEADTERRDRIHRELKRREKYNANEQQFSIGNEQFVQPDSI